MGWTIALTAAAAAFSAYGEYMSAEAEADAQELEAQRMRLEREQAELDAQAARVQGLQEALDVSMEMDRILAYNIAAVGYDPFSSQSFLAIESANQREERRDIDTIFLQTGRRELNAISRALGSEMARRSLLDSARTTRRVGLIRAGGKLFTGGARVAELL